jgi:hypothetical protein
MRALAAELTAAGDHAALWTTCEAGEPYGDDPAQAERIVVDEICANAQLYLPEALRPPPPLPDAVAGNRLAAFLRAWCGACPRPVVLLLDEIDALRDGALISVLRQLRSVYPHRPQAAPASLALIGLRDVREYKVAEADAGRLGGPSPFNITAEALTLTGFTREEVATLYGQHTAETGQAFADDAIDLAHHLTAGQPWLVNALAYDIVTRLKVAGTVTAAHVHLAKERLILARSTHLDSLADKLRDPRVRGVVAPILAGESLAVDLPTRDVDYCLDLGLVHATRGGLAIANPIYREVLPRELAVATDNALVTPVRRWARPDGRLDLDAILHAFVDFWRKDGEWMCQGQPWPEAAQQIVLMAFLQRLINGGGAIEREYGLGTRRLDLLIRWYVRVDGVGVPLEVDLHALEVKVWRDGRGDPLAEGLAQLEGYLERLGLARGTLVVFDARAEAGAWAERGRFEAAVSGGGREVLVVRV